MSYAERQEHKIKTGKLAGVKTSPQFGSRTPLAMRNKTSSAAQPKAIKIEERFSAAKASTLS
jgi:hypothetical protein